MMEQINIPNYRSPESERLLIKAFQAALDIPMENAIQLAVAMVNYISRNGQCRVFKIKKFIDRNGREIVYDKYPLIIYIGKDGE